MFLTLHDPKYLYADLFSLFSKIMELGIKDLFFEGESPDWK